MKHSKFRNHISETDCLILTQKFVCIGCGIGSEMQKERPALIIQNNIANLRSGNTIVIPITHDNSTLSCVASITHK